MMNPIETPFCLRSLAFGMHFFLCSVRGKCHSHENGQSSLLFAHADACSCDISSTMCNFFIRYYYSLDKKKRAKARKERQEKENANNNL